YVKIKKPGKLTATAYMAFSAASHFAISINQTSLTSNAYSLPSSEVFAFGTTPAAGYTDVATNTKMVKAEDIIRVSSTSTPSNNSGGTQYNYFSLFLEEQEISVSAPDALPQYSIDDMVMIAYGNS